MRIVQVRVEVSIEGCDLAKVAYNGRVLIKRFLKHIAEL